MLWNLDWRRSNPEHCSALAKQQPPLTHHEDEHGKAHDFAPLGLGWRRVMLALLAPIGSPPRRAHARRRRYLLLWALFNLLIEVRSVDQQPNGPRSARSLVLAPRSFKTPFALACSPPPRIELRSDAAMRGLPESPGLRRPLQTLAVVLLVVAGSVCQEVFGSCAPPLGRFASGCSLVLPCS